MTNEYHYGAMGEIVDSVAESAIKAATTLVYIGTAPVNLVRKYAESGAVNMPVQLSNMLEAQRKIGYSPAWGNFTLCEAVAAHFDNPQGNIGPIFIINVLDPDVHQKLEPITKSLIFKNGRATLASDTIILDTLALADKVEGVDFRVEYDYIRYMVVVSSLNAAAPMEGTVEATYKEVDPTAVDYDTIIGQATMDGVYSGVGALKLLYPELNAVANLIAAPGWSENPDVYTALLLAAKNINGHWDAFVLADIPIKDEVNLIDTIAKAVEWQAKKDYNNEFSKVCWPQAQDDKDRVFHLSTMAMVEYLRTDNEHSGVPMETCANKPIPAIRQYFGPDSNNKGFDKEAANLLTQKGILTMISWGGRRVLWGDHTAKFKHGAEGVDPRSNFDVTMRMLMHLANGFQLRWGTTIDKPMTRALKDTILNIEQEELDRLAGMGALIGTPRIEFLEIENPMEDLILGDFVFDNKATPTPPTKSLTTRVAYTTEGFKSYYGGDAT